MSSPSWKRLPRGPNGEPIGPFSGQASGSGQVAGGLRRAATVLGPAMPALYDAAAGGASARAARAASSAKDLGRQAGMTVLLSDRPGPGLRPACRECQKRHGSGTNGSHSCAPLRATLGFSPGGRGFGMGPRLAAPRRSGLQLFAQPLVDDLGVRLASGLFHHLADEEPQQPLLAAAIGLDLPLVLAQDSVDHRVELAHV